jgi:hypothetical protein
VGCDYSRVNFSQVAMSFLFYNYKIDSFHLCEELNLVLLLPAEFYTVDINVKLSDLLPCILFWYMKEILMFNICW